MTQGHEANEQAGIVRAGRRTLVTRSSLLARGLDATNWNVERIFSGQSEIQSVSSLGQVCVEKAFSFEDHPDLSSIEIYQIGSSTTVCSQRLTIASFDLHRFRGRKTEEPERAAAFGWSPDGRYLVTAILPDALVFLQITRNTVTKSPQVVCQLGHSAATVHPSSEIIAQFGQISYRVKERFLTRMPISTFDAARIVWSSGGNYVATTPPLLLWRFQKGRTEDTASFVFEDGSGYGPLAAGLYGLFQPRNIVFSSDEQSLFVLAEIHSGSRNILTHEDQLFVLSTPDQRIVERIVPPDTVSDMSWRAAKNQLLICCTKGKVYSMDSTSHRFTPLPFSAGVCCCHPNLDICGFADTGKLYIADLSTLSIVSEHYVEEGEVAYLDMCWSQDGRTMLAVSGTGKAYSFDLPQ
jgi:hypothetical protein